MFHPKVRPTIFFRVQAAAGLLMLSAVPALAQTSTITLLSPNGGQWWFAGESQKITWQTTGTIADVKLEFSRNNGGSWQTIVASTSNDGDFDWSVPDPVTNTALIRVSDAANSGTSDVSDQTFFITYRSLVEFTPVPVNPVLGGTFGGWDEHVRERGWFIFEDGMYHVWYGGWRGSYDHGVLDLVNLGYAYSSDGVHWTKSSANPINTGVWTEDVTVVKHGSTYYLYAEDENHADGDLAHIDLYTSTDRIHWTRHGTVLSANSAADWEASEVGTPTVWKDGDDWYMLYEGIGLSVRGQVGLATSADGTSWTRHPNNPVLPHPLSTDYDIAIDSILKINGVYYAYGHYEAVDRSWNGGMFTSTDLLSWTAYSGNPLPFNSPVIVDNGTQYLMYSLVSNASGVAPYQLAVSNHFAIPQDDIAPVISQTMVSAITSTAVTVSWQTDELADSQVEYGETTSYGSSSPLDPTRTLSHSVNLSNLQAGAIHHYRVKSKDAAGNLAVSNDFTFLTRPAAEIERIVLTDALNQNTLGTRTGGQFVSTGGWQTTGVEDMIVYDLGRYIENGSLELHVRNFRPAEQNTFSRQHFLSMFRMPWGNHHPVEALESGWDLHTGVNYSPGVKILSLTYDQPMLETIVRDDWDLSQTYQLKVTWNGNQLQYFRNGILQASHTHSEKLQLRYLFVGRDLTVSADLLTNFKNNQYPAPVGPIYSNIIVKETVATTDSLPPQVVNVVARDLYVNAARLEWATSEPAVCLMEYGTTTAYGQKTVVLGPSAQTFSTTLADLTPDQTYHYRIAARDSVGNITLTTDRTFTTLAQGTYLFKPAADTYVERSGLYGPTRDHANLGWMNLLASAGRECYLRFQITNIKSQISRTILRLHGRQSGKSGGILHALHVNWVESEVTWLNKPAVSGRQLGSIDSVMAGEWQEVAIDSVLPGNGVYDFAVIGTGPETISWDSRESTNFQPELLVMTQGEDATAPVISNVAANLVKPSSATITWTTNESADSQVEYGLTNAYSLASQIDPAAEISHRVAIIDLQANTLYHYRVKSRDPAGNLAVSDDYTFTTPPAAITLFADDFNTGLIDTSKWRRGTNSGNRLSVVNNALELRSQGRETAWLITRNAYAGQNTIACVKVVQPNDDGDLGLSPTYRLTSIYGIYNEPNFYRFYVYRSTHTGPYRLFVQWKKNGVEGGFDVTGNLVITGMVYLRVRTDDTNIHFEASLNGDDWTGTYSEPFGLPGYDLNSPFYYELAGYNTAQNGILTMDDFAITSACPSCSTSVSEPDSMAAGLLPLAFDLQNYPNPFLAETHIRFNLPVAAEVRLSVFDLIGREIEELYKGQRPAGFYETIWVARDRRRNDLRTGIYFVRLQYRTTQATTWSQIVRQVMMVR